MVWQSVRTVLELLLYLMFTELTQWNNMTATAVHFLIYVYKLIKGSLCFYVKSTHEKTILNTCNSISWEIHDSKLFLDHQTQQRAMSQNDTVKIKKNCKENDAEKTQKN